MAFVQIVEAHAWQGIKSTADPPRQLEQQSGILLISAVL